MREVSEGLSFTIGVTKATIFANIINVILNYVFIEHFKMGVAGSAWATFIARVAMMVFLYYVLIKEEKTRRYIKDFSLKIKDFTKEMFEKLIRLGFPTALQLFFEVTAFAGAAFICGLISAKDIAAHQIALSMASFTFNLCVGFSVASTVMIGRKLGEKDFVNLEKVGFNNLKIAFIFLLMCGLVFIIGKDVLLEENKDVYELLDLKFGFCRLMMAVPEELLQEKITDYAHMRVATKFPKVAEKFFNNKGMQMEFIKLNGSIELGPMVGLAEVIVDIVETGRTLKENKLIEVAHIANATARFIANRVSFKIKFDKYVDGQTCMGLDKLVLNNNFADATNRKEALVYDMFQYLGADASLYNYAKSR